MEFRFRRRRRPEKFGAFVFLDTDISDQESAIRELGRNAPVAD
jgi:hypothetical protein